MVEFINIDLYIADNKLNDNINVGAYGWQHPHWLGEFYHEDLPQEWQLNYYSNVFNCVLVPADYWRPEQGYACESWLDDVHEEFMFYLELPAGLLSLSAKEKYLQQVSALRAQLAGFVISEDSCMDGEGRWWQSLTAIAPLYLCDFSLFDEANFHNDRVFQVWTDAFLQKTLPVKSSVPVGSLAVVHDDLTDLRRSRHALESYFDFVKNEHNPPPSSVIVMHPDLSTSQLSQLRAVIEVMGL